VKGRSTARFLIPEGSVPSRKRVQVAVTGIAAEEVMQSISVSSMRWVSLSLFFQRSSVDTLIVQDNTV